MNEMLGNQYYLARRFKEATSQFEKSLLIEPNNVNVKKKLIICYLQINDIKMSLKIFADLISKDIDVILDSDPRRDDCPCQQMIIEIENFPSNLKEAERKTALGILWLYCDILISHKYFNSLLESEPDNLEYQTITNIINQSFHN
jgi:tetratricopeptide (TPR) repeat protein